MPDTFSSRVVCCPLIKASVNVCVICQILGEFQAVCNEGSLNGNVVYYLLSRQAVNVKLIG